MPPRIVTEGRRAPARDARRVEGHAASAYNVGHAGGDMAKRVQGKAAIVVGGGQTPGETIGNGRATAIVLAREGARVIVADRTLDSAQATVDMIRGEGGEAWAFEADITEEESARRLIAESVRRLG